MINTTASQTADEFQLKEAISLNHRVDREAILLFGTIESFLTEILSVFNAPHSKLITASPVIPEIAIAADRAEMECDETYSDSPFASDINSVIKRINSSSDIVYLANPNRLTGATYSNLELKQLAKELSNGLLIIDEYFSDFSGLSSLALTGLRPNLVILRTFENWKTSSRSECGYAFISEELIGTLSDRFSNKRLDRSTAKKCLEILDNKKDKVRQIADIQKQALETTTALSNLGLKCQITPTDFIVIHVDEALSVRNQLGSFEIDSQSVEFANSSLSFLIYRVNNPEKNKMLVQALMKILSGKPFRNERQTVIA